MATRKFDPYAFLSSVKFAVVILIALAVTSIAGTVIEQGGAYEKYLESFGQPWADVIVRAGLDDMYHSWWFVLLLTLFSLNLVLCSWQRLPGVIRQIRHPQRVLTPELEKGLSLVDSVKKKGGVDSWKDAVMACLQQRYGAVQAEQADGAWHLYVEKGAYARLGVYVTHLSIIIVFIGGIVGSIWGYRGYVQIPEGQAVDRVYPRDGKPPVMLGFALRCDKFSLGYYPTGMVKEYRTDATLIKADGTTSKHSLLVNHPLSHDGITFYQSNYGVTRRAAVLKVFVAGRQARDLVLGTDAVELPTSPYRLRVADYSPNYDGSGPALMLEVSKNGMVLGHMPIFKNVPDGDLEKAHVNTFEQYAFRLADYQEGYYTGLQVTKDPGVWLVWLGCILMMAGLYVSFFVARKRLWARIAFTGDRTVVTLAGHAPRMRLFEDEFARLLDGVKELTL